MSSSRSSAEDAPDAPPGDHPQIAAPVDQATVRVTPDGGIEVRAGVHSHGQGMETTLAQIAHEVLGQSFKEISAETGLSVNTLLSRKHYAVLHLRQRLQSIYETFANK